MGISLLNEINMNKFLAVVCLAAGAMAEAEADPYYAAYGYAGLPVAGAYGASVYGAGVMVLVHMVPVPMVLVFMVLVLMVPTELIPMALAMPLVTPVLAPLPL